MDIKALVTFSRSETKNCFNKQFILKRFPKLSTKKQRTESNSLSAVCLIHLSDMDYYGFFS